MAGSARQRHFKEFIDKMYPAYSRKATQVVRYEIALEAIGRAKTAQEARKIAADVLSACARTKDATVSETP